MCAWYSASLLEHVQKARTDRIARLTSISENLEATEKWEREANAEIFEVDMQIYYLLPKQGVSLGRRKHISRSMISYVKVVEEGVVRKCLDLLTMEKEASYLLSNGRIESVPRQMIEKASRYTFFLLHWNPLIRKLIKLQSTPYQPIVIDS